MSDINTIAAATQGDVREIEVITAEIRVLHRQAQQLILGYAIQIGQRLAEAKAQLKHGDWGEWLKNEVEFSQSTANNFMRIFEEYGAEQLGLFGPEANSQTLGNLPYTKALRLLAIPAEEREEFVKEHDVENISSRQLDQLIKERDEALLLSEEEKKRAQDLEKKLESMNGEIDEVREQAKSERENETESIRQELEEAQRAANERAEALENAKKELAEVQEKAEKAKAAAAKAKEQLKKLKDEPPVVSPEILEEMRKKAETEASAAAERKLEEQLAAASKRAEDAEREAKAAKESAEETQKRLALAAPEVAQFQVFFAAWQADYNRMQELLGKMPQEMAEKLRVATDTVLKQWRERAAG